MCLRVLCGHCFVDISIFSSLCFIWEYHAPIIVSLFHLSVGQLLLCSGCPFVWLFRCLATRGRGTRRVFRLALGDALVEPTAALGHAKDIGGVWAVQTAMLLRCSSTETATGRRRFHRFGRSHIRRRSRRCGSGRRGHAEQRQKDDKEDGDDALAKLHGSSGAVVDEE
jgi:hypothetical protein